MAQKKKNFSTVLVIVASLLIGFLGGYLAGFRYGIRFNRESLSSAMPQQFQRQPSRVDISSIAVEIVKELNCICGCKMELLPCTCEELRGSKEIKHFVQTLVDEGLLKSEVVGRVVEKYGQAVLIRNSS